MPTIKCPSCGHSSFHSNIQCVNCGAALVPEPAYEDMALDLYEDYQSPTQPFQRLATRHAASQPGTALEPYRSLAPAPVSPFVQQIQTGNGPFEERNLIPTIMTNPPLSDVWIADALPWWFPRRRPDIAGSIMDVQSQQEDIRAYSSDSIIRMIADMFWGGTQEQHRYEKEMVPIIVIRVRTAEDIQKIARFRGY